MMLTPRCNELAESAAAALAKIDLKVLHRETPAPRTSQRYFVVTIANVGELRFIPRRMTQIGRDASINNVRS